MTAGKEKLVTSRIDDKNVEWVQTRSNFEG